MPFALIPLLAAIVPEAVKWIAGDSAGKAAATVTEIAGKVLGTDDPARALEAAADPNKALEFKMAVLAAQSASEKEETARMMAELADRQSARSQTVELAKAGSAIAWGPVLISFLVTVAFGAVLWFLLQKAIPDQSKELALILVGTLSAKFGDVVAYWVGSSSGSAQKSSALEKALASIR